MYDPLDDYKIPAKMLKETREMLVKEHGREFTADEVMEVTVLVKKLANIGLDIILEDERRQEMLLDHPGGFLFDKEGYSCMICGNGAKDEGIGFDKYGLKCMRCQRAVEKGIIPGEITQDRESYYTEFELGSFFNVMGEDGKGKQTLPES